MKALKIGLFVFLSGIVLVCSSCEGSMPYDYVFSNETQYTINVYVDKPFTYNEQEFDKGTTIVLYGSNSYSASEKAISVRGESSLDFYWSASNASDNQYIYTSVSGKKVVFRER